MNNALNKEIPSGIMVAIVGLILPYVPNITAEALQKALETINNSNTATEKPSRPLKPYTRKGAAEMLGVSIPTIDRYMASGLLTRVRYSARAIRISADSVHKLMQGGMA